MKKYAVISLLVLMTLNNVMVGSEKENKISDVPLLSVQEKSSKKYTISKNNDAVCATISLTMMATILASGFGYGIYLMVKGFKHSSNPPSFFCPDDANLTDGRRMIINFDSSPPGSTYENVCPILNPAFQNNTQAREYARNKMVDACFWLARTRICFNVDNGVYKRPCREFDPAVLNRLYETCHPPKAIHNSRNELARVNTTQNRKTQQPKHQKQNFRQHMRGRNKRG